MELARQPMPGKPLVAAKPRLKAVPLPSSQTVPASLSIVSQLQESLAENCYKASNNKLVKCHNYLPNNAATSKLKPVTHSRAVSPEAPTPTVEATPVKSPEPPPLPSLPPPIQRKGQFSPSSSLSLPASFRSRNDSKSKLQTSPTVHSLTSASNSSRSTKSLVRNVSPPRKPPPPVAPKPQQHTPSHKFTTNSETSNSIVHCRGDREIHSPIKDTLHNVSGKCDISQAKIEPQESNNSSSPASRRSSITSQKPTQPNPCPEILPHFMSSPTSKSAIPIKPIANCPAQDVKKDSETIDVKSPVGTKSSVPPPLPKNPPLAGLARNSRRSNIKSVSETQPGLGISQQILHQTMSHTLACNSVEKVLECDTVTQVHSVTSDFKHSISGRSQTDHSHKNENIVNSNNRSSNPANILGTSHRSKPSQNNITHSHVSVSKTGSPPQSIITHSHVSVSKTGSPPQSNITDSHVSVSKTGTPPKPASRTSTTLQSPFSTDAVSKKSTTLHDNTTDQSQTSCRTKQNVGREREPELVSRTVHQDSTGDELKSHLTEEYLVFSHDENVSSSLLGCELDETSDMLKEIEELLKKKLGDKPFDVENKDVANIKGNPEQNLACNGKTLPTETSNGNNNNLKVNSEQSLAFNKKTLKVEHISDHRLNSSSPARSKYRSSLTSEKGRLGSLDESTDKTVPQKPKRTFLHNTSHIHSDVSSLKLKTGRRDTHLAWEGHQDEGKCEDPNVKSLIKNNESTDLCPPLPPRNKPRSLSLKEAGGAPPLMSKRSVSMDTDPPRETVSFAARNFDSSQSGLHPAQPGPTIIPNTKMRRSRLSREALPPPPPGPPKRSATFSPGDSKQDDAGQSGETTTDTQDTMAAAGSNYFKKSYSLMMHKQSNFKGNAHDSREMFNSSRRVDRPLSEVSQQSTSSEHEGFESQNIEEIVSSGTDTEPEQDKEEIYVRRKAKKVFFIAKEIVSSESTFVDVLRLLNLDFRVHISKSTEKLGHPVLPSETLNKILNFLPQLLNLNEELLKDLKQRIDKWDTNPRLADIFVKKGPFLKLYSSYIRNFETASAVLEDACKKNPAFALVVKEFEMSPRCAKLALKHYMLKPIQRIPQYKLLLQDYLKHLSEGSPDYKDTINALSIVSEVADHANDSMRHGDNLHKLMEVQRSLIGQFEVIQPGRVLVKQGELQKLSRKEMQPRMFFLFNDVLLYTTPASTGYKINNILPLTGMKINFPKLEDYKYEFNIISVQRSFTLCASSFEEKESWVSALETSIEDNAKKHHTFQQSVKQGLQTSLQDKNFVLGHKAPLWVPDARVTMCMLCLLEFSLTLRRHHCRSCGRVVCFHCSENKAPLLYLNYEKARVCDNCFDKLKEEMTSEIERSKNRKVKEDLPQSEENPVTCVPPEGDVPLADKEREDRGATVSKHGLSLHSLLGRFQKMKKSHHERRRPNSFRPSVLKEVHANDEGSDMCGYLHAYKSRKWKRLWFVVKGKVLYTYKASEDMAATESMPLLGYEVSLLNTWFEGCKPDLLFELSHQNNQPLAAHKESMKTHSRVFANVEKATPRLIFRTDSASSLEKWVTILRESSLSYE